ncbi:alpha/beta fold hydrolase [Mucilaginibacter pedocola]|uniref:Alpha/beta hydrolase n=1 Tax=Mucilaginibacter pedocola TaxID=1792845 RepID=A0A1S9P6U6_9SPHI|nr:alpha/beta hydrolase [Mucilaginibacter pedocola]OOQ56557.1 alpha/beta hydrolase [Mucilaginibacter pedocola]
MKQTIILLHGLFGGLSNWHGVIKYFEGRYNILVPQLPLYQKHEGDTVEYLVNFLVETVEEAGAQQVVLVGNSLGGHIAIRYAHRSPHRVSKMVLTGSSGLYENMQAGSYLRRSNYAYLKERIAATFYDAALATDELVAEVMQVTTDTYKCLCIVKAAKATQRDKVLGILAEIETPVLLIWGNNDTITPPDVARHFWDNLPDARLVMLNNCGHAPMMERPDEFNKTLEDFLNEEE